MIVLGLWDGHDSGAAILVDGTLAAAANEERFTRRKLEVAFPDRSIEACLDLAGIRPDRVDIVAASTTDVAKAVARVWPATKERFYQVRRRKSAPGVMSSGTRWLKYRVTELGPNPVSRAVSRVALRRHLSRLGLAGARLELHDHHLCHAVAAASASGFERALVVTIDGVGDGVSATVGVLDGGRLTTLARTPARHSPGIFFEHVTSLLNMRELEDEGKVMALAHYAPRLDRNPLAALVDADGMRFRTAAAGHALRRSIARVHWSHPNEQLARMAQDALERAVVGVVRRGLAETGMRRVALSGGVASNIQVNRRIRLMPEVDEVFVFPHMGDGGLAVGAALASAVLRDGVRPLPLPTLGLGPAYGDAEIERVLQQEGLAHARPGDLAAEVADRLVRRDVVMWFQGRMECGPRALGHRSVLARPDAPDLRDRLNLVLKRRVWYQPFCPSVLESDAAAMLADAKGRPDRFMTMAYEVRPAWQSALAGAMGPDKTCRPQIVPDDEATPWAALLRAMKQRTGVGAVLNTSFNMHGEPLVCAPAEALDVFRRSGADALACGPYLVEARP